MQVQIWDPVAPHRYGPQSLSERPLGGTEASVIRVANGLTALGHEVRIVFEPEDWGDVQIVLRNPNVANLGLGARPAILWCHDLLSEKFIGATEKRNAKSFAAIVAVSDFHKENVDGILGGNARRIYNPVIPGVAYQDTKRGQAIILSSPCKGLEFSLQVFAAMSKKWELVILNPGYEPGPEINTKRVTTLGPRPHAEGMSRLAESRLLIHANRAFPETFGLVFAEAKTLGVPVVTFDHGAAREVLGDFGSCLPLDTSLKDFAKEADRLMNTPHRPHPGIFAIDGIAREWEGLIREVVA